MTDNLRKELKKGSIIGLSAIILGVSGSHYGRYESIPADVLIRLCARQAQAENAFLRVPFKHPFLRGPILAPK